MVNQSQSNKRIAKNTLLLYFRMLLLMGVNLYTSRIILQILGVEDFGIYNVIGGVVAMFSVISGSLAAAISRFLTFELGCGNIENLKRVFSSSVTIQLLLSIVILVLAESIGVFFMNTQMTIPPNRIVAANWVMQFSLLTFVINLISVPYNAAIIAHEKMAAFAYVSIFEGLGKLGIAFLIMISPIDKLIFYAVLMCILAVIIRVLYGVYCKKNFEECTCHLIFDKKQLKTMFGFAQWSFIGNSAGIMRNQGVNILLNLYYGPIVNAANGIANQVSTAVYGFANNFIIAVNPQIIKSYSQNEIEKSSALVKNSSRLSFLLLLLIIIPVIIETDFIMSLWLGNVPQYASNLVRLSLVMILFESLSLPLITIQNATGIIRDYQLVVGVLHLLNFPFSWIILSLGAPPTSVYFISIILVLICFYARLFMLKRIVNNISIKDFTIDVFLRCTLIFIFSYICVYIEYTLIDNAIIVIATSIITTILFGYIFGMKKDEKKIIIDKIIKIIK